MFSYKILLSLFATMAWSTDPDIPKPAPVDVNIDGFVGRFYLMFIEKRLASLIYKDVYCKTHDYKKLNQTTLKIYHAGTTGSPTGNITVEKRGGKLHFNTGEVGKILYESELRPKFYNMTVIKVRENSSGQDSQYDYIITTVGRFFWVRSRDVTTFFTKYEEEVKAFLEKYGYTSDMVYKMPQGENCNYAPEI